MSDAFDPRDEAVRQTLLYSHPVMARGYTIPTSMIQRAFALVQSHVFTRRTGLVFYAHPRMGKTWCAIAIQDLVTGSFPQTHVSLFTARSSARYSEQHVLRLILEGLGYAPVSGARATKLFDSAIADVRVKVNTKNGKQFVLIIDEAQLLNQGDWQQLVCFHNQLELFGIKMTTVSFAQPEILHQRTALLASQDVQIIARFMSIPVAFQGCSTSKELTILLTAFDLESEYPEESGCSYTRFFLPRAFEQGFRLTSYCDRLWRALSSSAGVGKDGMVSVELICLVLGDLLVVSRLQDCENFVFSDDEISSAVTGCNFQAFQDTSAAFDV
jgi:hypothetical protein